MERKLYTVNDSADYLSLHPKTVRTLIELGEANGGLRCVRIGRAVRLEKDALDEFIASHITGQKKTVTESDIPLQTHEKGIREQAWLRIQNL